MHNRWMSLVVAGILTLAGSAAAQTPSYHLARSIPLSDGGWDYASVDQSTGRLYLARTDGVTAVDLKSGMVTAKLAPAERGHEVLPLKDGAELLLTNGTPGLAQFLDAKTGAILASVKVGKGPDAAVFDEASGMVAVMNHAGGTVNLINPISRMSVAEIQVGGTLEFAAVVDGKLFINDEDASEMAVVDLKTRKVGKRIKMPGCKGPTGLAFLQVSHRLMASCDGVAAIVDPAKMKLVAALPIGVGADAVIYDHVRKLAFIPSGESGDLAIFADEAKGVRSIGKISTQKGARTGAVDEATGRVFLAAADYTPPAAAGGRPQMKPGSVVLLEIDP